MTSQRPEPTADSSRSELVALLERLATSNADESFLWPGLTIRRADRLQPRVSVVYEPCVVIVGQGRKRGYVGSEAFTYDPLHYLVVGVPLPLAVEVIEASPEKPYLAFRLRLPMAALSELLIEIGDAISRRKNRGGRRGIYVSRLSDELYDAVLRFVRALADPVDRRVLAPLAERELLYRLLTEDQGDVLREVALRDSHSHRIAQVVRYLQTNYDQPLDISTVAGAANMSPSTLHHSFRQVTSSSPLQYLKQIRLHQARLLMLQDGLGAGEAADRVGYGNKSQFSREYRRLFGAPPTRDLALLRTQVAAAD